MTGSALALTEDSRRAATWRRWAPVAIAAATVAVYFNMFSGPFILDDGRLISENPRIRQLWPLSETLANSSRPVVQLTLALNYATGRLNVADYHACNLAIHLLAALVLYGVVRRTLSGVRLGIDRPATAEALALAVALIWAVHPLQTESVTYIVQRGESLMGLFCLLTLYAVIRSAESDRRIWWQVGAVLACALGMASKPVMVVTPLLVLLYDRTFLAGSLGRALGQRRWLYLALATTWSLVPWLLHRGPQEWETSAGFSFEGVSPWEYARTQPGVVMHYLKLSFWPRSLCLDYAWPVARSFREIVLPSLGIGVLLLGMIGAVYRNAPVGFLGAWFFLILGPTSSFIPIGDLAFEHRMYLPLAAVISLVVMAGYHLGRQVALRAGLGRASVGRAGVVALAVVVVGLGTRTVRRNKDYRSGLAIWESTVRRSPGNARAHNNLANALSAAGDNDRAFAEYAAAVQLQPAYPEAYNNLANMLDRRGRFEEAIAHYAEAVRLNPEYAEAHYNWGVTLAEHGQPEEAIRRYAEALRLKPDYPEARYNWGVALVRLGRVSDSIVQFAETVRLQPNHAQAWFNWGLALAKQGQLSEAVERYETALRFDSRLVMAHRQLAAALEELGQTDRAREHREAAVELSPPTPSDGRDLREAGE